MLCSASSDPELVKPARTEETATPLGRKEAWHQSIAAQPGGDTQRAVEAGCIPTPSTSDLGARQSGQLHAMTNITEHFYGS